MKAFVDAAVGFAANEEGKGVAYVRLGRDGTARILRVPFSVERFPALRDREVGYAALTAVSLALRRHGFDSVRFVVADEGLTHDIRRHRELPAALTLPYVRLRCALNQFRRFEIAPAASECDLTARAHSEVSMHVAA